MSIKNIIFDWSGTLSNDLTSVYDASMIVFKKLGKPPISLEEYRRKFTLPYMVFWNKYFPKLSKEDEDKLYVEVIHQVKEPTIYAGVKDELERLKSLGINMIVISSHPHDKLIKEASSYGIQSLFREINGSIHDKTETILEIMKRNNFYPNQTTYVGDMTHDIDAGKKARVITIALGWGYQSKKRLMKSNPDYYIEDISNLDKLVK